jgi:hypothetical protein
MVSQPSSMFHLNKLIRSTASFDTCFYVRNAKYLVTPFLLEHGFRISGDATICNATIQNI